MAKATSSPEEFARVLTQARQLDAQAKLRLLEELLPDLATALEERTGTPRPSWIGRFEGQGPVPTEEDIRELRREIWPDR